MPSTGEWTNKSLSSHTVAFYSTVQKNELLKHFTTWRNRANIMMSERSQTQKSTYCVIPFIRCSRMARKQWLFKTGLLNDKWGWELTRREQRGHSGLIKMFYISTELLITGVYTFCQKSSNYTHICIFHYMKILLTHNLLYFADVNSYFTAAWG